MSTKPVTVAVLADTHVNSLAELPGEVLGILDKVDAIIHLGDFVSQEILSDLRKSNRFYGVIGNHDELIGSSELKVMDVLELGGKRLGIMHGLYLPLARPKRMRALFRKHNIDALLFGHNHLASSKTEDGMLIFNPGTVTGQFPAIYGSFGILTLNGTVTGEIVPIKSQNSYRGSLFSSIMAPVIRVAIRWLEAWPYIDPRPLYSHIRLHLSKLFQAQGNSDIQP